MMNEPREPPLNSLKVFVVVANQESISKAAALLSLTESAVSRQIKNIEDRLEISLFERKNRRLFLTEKGYLLQQCCNKIFSELSRTLQGIAQPVEQEPLVVSCEPTLTMNWLIPNLPKFNERNPNIPIRIFAAGGDINLSAEKVDIALRRNDFTWNKSYHSEKVCDELIGPVCTKKYWEKHNQNQNSVTILHTKSRFEAWQKWRSNSSSPLLSERDMILEHFYLCLQAASSNLGVAISSIFMCFEEIKTGKLISPYSFIQDGSSYHLISETPIHLDDRKHAFYQWVIDEFSSMNTISIGRAHRQDLKH